MTGWLWALSKACALVVSSLSNQVSRHARESELHQSQLQKLYELSQSILLLDRQKPLEPQLASLLHSTLRVEGVVLWNAYDLHMCRSGQCDVTDDEVRSVYFMDSKRERLSTRTSRRILRLGIRPIGALVICGHSLDTGYDQCSCVADRCGDGEGTLFLHRNQCGGSAAE